MTGLRNQRRLAAQIMKVGRNRVWIDPEKTVDVETAMTREEIRRLVHEGTIKSLPPSGVSRVRARVLHNKKKKGRRRGPGSRTGAAKARVSKKEAWMSKIRAQRKRLQELKTKRVFPESAYQKLYRMAGSGRFESVGDLERYLKAHELWRKR